MSCAGSPGSGASRAASRFRSSIRGREGVERLGPGGDREGLPVPVEDRAALGPERDRLGLLALRQPRRLVVLDDLQVAEPAEESEEGTGEDAARTSVRLRTSGARPASCSAETCASQLSGPRSADARAELGGAVSGAACQRRCRPGRTRGRAAPDRGRAATMPSSPRALPSMRASDRAWPARPGGGSGDSSSSVRALRSASRRYERRTCWTRRPRRRARGPR